MIGIEPSATSNYRAYIMDNTGHISDVHFIKQAHDHAAWRAVLALTQRAEIELWCGDREVPRPFHILNRIENRLGHARSAANAALQPSLL